MNIGSEKNTINFGSNPIKTVLVVEDDTLFLTAVRAKLNRNGCRVLTAKDVSEAEEKWAMARDIIDLVISDNKLGSDRGVDLVQRFQQQEPGVQFILCSGEPIEEPLPGVPFVQKPFGIDQIGIPSSAAVK